MYYYYAEEIIIENLIINYLLLFFTAKIIKINYKLFRLLISSFIGALYAVLFYMQNTFINSIFIKIVVSIIMIVIAFKIINLRQFLKIILIFYVLSIFLGGMIIAISYLIKRELNIHQGVIISNDLNWFYVFFGIILTIVFISKFRSIIINKKIKDGLNFLTKIVISNEEITINSYVDTGNSLKDPFTNKPVTIVEFDAIESILPKEIKKILLSVDKIDFSILNQDNLDLILLNKIRVIPYQSVGNEISYILGLETDYIEINNNIIDKGIIGVCNKKLASDGTFQSLINPELFY